MNTAYPQIGSVSHATMREQDLIPAFYDEIAAYADMPAAAGFLAGWDPENWGLEPDGEWPADEDPWWQSESAMWLSEALFDVLQEIAPPYCYFGAHEGDGSDFGFWPSLESLEEDATPGFRATYQDEVIKVADMAEVPTGFSGYVMRVTDHGNVTLYEPVVTYREVWSVV